MTYFLCKYYSAEFGGLVPNRYAHVLVRPCKWSYGKVLDFMNGKVKAPLELDGQVAMFTTSSMYASSQQPTFKTFDEWMVWFNYTKGIVPDFEEIYYCKDLKDYVAKTTNLRTGDVLWDKSDELKQKLCDR